MMQKQMAVNEKLRIQAKKQPEFKKITETEMAVKLQSKYQLVKSKQVQHLFQEIKLMNDLKHPFILDLKGVA
jgi:uroporphyrinogen-III decarboxylase